MSEKVNLAVIGCGRIAGEGHLPYYAARRDVRLAAAVDVNEDNLRRTCRRFGIKSSYDSPGAMFSAVKPDAALICTPSWAHRELVLMAAGSGAHVFCEKPMAPTAAECRDMIEACARAGVLLQLGMVKRFDAGVVKARKMILRGRLGEVSQIYASCLNPPARMDTPLMKTAEKWLDALGVDFEQKTGFWRYTDPRAGGGQLLELGTHMADLAIFWAGERPAAYAGFVNRKRPDMAFEDQGTMLLKFPSGAIATVELNMSVTLDNLFGEKARLFGDRATLDVNHFNAMWYGVPLYEYIPTRLTYFGRLSPLTGAGLPVPVPVGKKIYMHKLQADYFIDSIKGEDTDYFGLGPDFAATGEDGLAVLEAIEAAYRSEEA